MFFKEEKNLTSKAFLFSSMEQITVPLNGTFSCSDEETLRDFGRKEIQEDNTKGVSFLSPRGLYSNPGLQQHGQAGNPCSKTPILIPDSEGCVGDT